MKKIECASLRERESEREREREITLEAKIFFKTFFREKMRQIIEVTKQLAAYEQESKTREEKGESEREDSG
jgi:hypothetical protein